MKKSTNALLFCCLAGCASFPTAQTVPGISPGVKFPHQDTAPMPWVNIIPSKRALEMKDVDFKAVTDGLRYDISFAPHRKRFAKVCYILIDYGILPAGKSKKNELMVKYGGQTYSQGFEETPERYILKISFFNGSTRPPSAPSFEETITMPTKNIPSQEAITMLTHELVEDLMRTPLDQVRVDMD